MQRLERGREEQSRLGVREKKGERELGWDGARAVRRRWAASFCAGLENNNSSTGQETVLPAQGQLSAGSDHKRS